MWQLSDKEMPQDPHTQQLLHFTVGEAGTNQKEKEPFPHPHRFYHFFLNILFSIHYDLLTNLMQMDFKVLNAEQKLCRVKIFGKLSEESFFWGGSSFFVKLLMEQIEPKQCAWKHLWQNFLHALINVHPLSLDVRLFLCEFLKCINATHRNYQYTLTTWSCWAFYVNGPFTISLRPLTSHVTLRLDGTAPSLGSECIWHSAGG